jgi:hypothetical protein
MENKINGEHCANFYTVVLQSNVPVVKANYCSVDTVKGNMNAFRKYTFKGLYDYILTP